MTTEKEKRRVAQQLNSREAQVEALALRIDRLLSNNLADVLSGLKLKKMRAVDAAQALADLEEEIEKDGLGKQLRRIKDIYRDELDVIRDEFERTTGRAFRFTSVDKANLEAIMNDRITLASSQVNKYLGDVRGVVISATFTGEKPTLRSLRARFQNKLVSNLWSELNTSLAVYNRMINRQKAEEAGLKLFLYVGPNDKITRPFCRARVDQVFSQEEIDRWDNGQKIPANIYLGGYNCRHHLRPVSEEYAKELGYKG